jgi:Bor protein
VNHTKILTLSLALGLSGCFTTRIHSGYQPALPAQAAAATQHHTLALGIAELSEPADLDGVCPGGTWATIEEKQTPVNGLLAALTSQIYTPRTYAISCSAGGYPQAAAPAWNPSAQTAPYPPAPGWGQPAQPVAPGQPAPAAWVQQAPAAPPPPPGTRGAPPAQPAPHGPPPGWGQPAPAAPYPPQPGWGQPAQAAPPPPPPPGWGQPAPYPPPPGWGQPPQPAPQAPPPAWGQPPAPAPYPPPPGWQPPVVPESAAPAKKTSRERRAPRKPTPPPS